MLITQVKWTSLIQKNSLNFLYEINIFHQILNFWISFPHCAFFLEEKKPVEQLIIVYLSI